MFTSGILTVSDKVYAGLREDISGKTLRKMVDSVDGFTVVKYDDVPDEKEKIAAKLLNWSDESIDVILTTGGTGLGARDVTPEATRMVIDKEVPGIPEALRINTIRKTPAAMLSRAVAGVRNQTLIVNMPGSPKAVEEHMEVLIPALTHAMEMIKGIVTEHDTR